jgi:hypothetical protein
MIKGFGLYNLSSTKEFEGKDMGFDSVKNSIEEILYDIGYEEGSCINFSPDSSAEKNNIWKYSSPGEGGCIVRYGNEKIGTKQDFGGINLMLCTDKKRKNNLTGAILTFVGPTGSLIQRTKNAFEKNFKFSWFER